MAKTILITGATDGIGFATATQLVKLGHHILLHGRNKTKLESAKQKLTALNTDVSIECYVADLSVLEEVRVLANEINSHHKKIDVLINNAGVYVVGERVSVDGLDTRYVVNTISPYLLTKLLLPLLSKHGRIINLSSAAQAGFDPNELATTSHHSDGKVYAQSKLALTMWSMALANSLKDSDISVIAVNPGSMLGSKMVKEAYGVNGKDIQIGVNILCDLALSDEYKNASGQYFDNDMGRLSTPHPHALDMQNNQKVINVIEAVLTSTLQ
ncbi:MAG: SDR family NAD(P)-dependent oxidoreductase [Pseudomonadota bacterium]